MTLFFSPYIVLCRDRWYYVEHYERKWFKQASVYLGKQKKKRICKMIINVKYYYE